MKKINMKRVMFSLLSVVMLITMMLPAGSPAVMAQSISWPASGNWTATTDCFCDPQGDKSPAESDLIGCYDDGDYDIGPAVYYYFDSDPAGYAYFRERVAGDPSEPVKFQQKVWVVLFDLPVPGNYEYLLSIDGGAEEVQLWENTAKEYLVWNPILGDEAETPLLPAYPTATYARIVDDSTGHYFVDWAIPLDRLTELGITEGTTMYFCTSTQANNYNKDYLDCYGADLVVTEKSEAGVSLTDRTYNVTYTVCNRAAAPAAASNAAIFIDGSSVMEDSIPELAAGECYTSTVGPFTMSGNSDTIKVCADNGDVVNESNEDNNCRENIFTFVCEPPEADFSVSDQTPCVNTSVDFTDLSTPVGEITSWSWDVEGDGS